MQKADAGRPLSMLKTLNRLSLTQTTVTQTSLTTAPRATTLLPRAGLRARSINRITTQIPEPPTRHPFLQLRLRLSLRSKSPSGPTTQTTVGQTAASSCARVKGCESVLQAGYHSGTGVFQHQADWQAFRTTTS